MRLFSRCVVAGLVGLLAVLAPLPPTAAAHVDVIVQAPGAQARATAAVRGAGGTITADLPIVGGFAATMPRTAAEHLAAVPGVAAVTADAALRPTASSTSTQSVKSVYRNEIGAEALAAHGATGDGVRVALVDTGIDTEVATAGDLAGRVVPVADPTTADGGTVECVNFSGERTCDDTFGHGTFLAGLIAGSGAASAGSRAGVAPGAEIVSVKVGGADGSADVSKVLAAIQWVVSFADTYDIKVLNLSLGTNSTVPPSIDPLNLAVQRAWAAGITVVVSAGNLGRPAAGSSSGTVTKPGDDPFVITVGSVDDMETPTPHDDRLPAFSSWGPTAHGHAKPDLVAPGGRVVSLRAPGSKIDGVPGSLDATYRRGSGTSMSAAMVSGLVAQLLQARPDWRPDDVKAALVAGARDVASHNRNAVGAGLAYGPGALQAQVAPTHRDAVASTGLGSLRNSAGSVLVSLSGCTSLLDLCGVLTDETSQGNPWIADAYAATQWTPLTWYASQWVTAAAGHNWQGHNWQATTWASGHNWQGHNWQGSSWYGETDKRSYGTTTRGSASYGAWG